MMVSPVSFRATSASSFQDMIKKPQTYTQQPTASTSIEGGKKKGKAGKTILGLAVAAAAIAGGMVAVNKYSDRIGKFVTEKIKSEKVAGYANNALEKVSKWGETIGDRATAAVSFIRTKGNELIAKIKPEQVAEDVAEVAEEVIAG